MALMSHSSARVMARLAAPFQSLSRAARRDLVILGSLGVVAYAGAVMFEAFETFSHFLARYEADEFGEIASAFVIASVGAFIFAGRRMFEGMRELKLRMKAEDEAKALAMHDPLTGLPNRRMLETELKTVIESGEAVAVAIVDLDRFKAVNDLHGHAGGDALLVMIAERLAKTVETRDFVSRIGGDEFVLVLRNSDDPEGLIRRLTHLTAALAAPVNIGAAEVSVGVTTGVVVASGEVSTPAELMRRADMALYRAKDAGRGRFAFFETEMDVKVQARLQLERKVCDAIAKDQVEPFFQPLVTLETGATYGYEVLARMRHPDGTLLMPDHFIPVAEELGVIGEMTINILRRACKEARDWPGAPLLSVNISQMHLRDPELPQNILKVLIETGFAPARLQVEITESALVGDFDLARTTLVSLRNQGIRVALDDFGTGYSSLRHLRELPFDSLKIDKSFIEHMNEDAEARTVVRTIVDLARNLGLALTAEGIETPVNAEALRAFGCETGQGYWYGRPVSAEATRALFTEGAERHAAGSTLETTRPAAAQSR